MKKASVSVYSHFPDKRQSRFTPRKRPVQDRSHVTVDSILQAAAQVLVQYGYERANTTLIANKAGVSVGTLYQYFPNKDAIYSELLRRELTQTKNLMMYAVERQPYASLTERFHDSIEAMIKYKAEHPKLHRALKTELGRIDGTRSLQRIKQEALAITEALLVAHSEELPVRDPARAAFFVVNMVEGIVGAALLEGRAMMTEPDFAASLSAAVLGVLKTTVFINERKSRDE